MNIEKLATLLLLIFCGYGCGTAPYSNEYDKQQPAFDLFNFFNGNVTGWAIVQNRKGQVVQRFKANIDGTVANDTLTLDETFTYYQGEGLEKRIWTIQRDNLGAYLGGAGDIIGQAKGSIYGNALNWQYAMDLTIDSGTYRVKFDDWMWMMDQNTLINRAYIKKFGIIMAEVTLFMQKQKQ